MSSRRLYSLTDPIIVECIFPFVLASRAIRGTFVHATVTRTGEEGVSAEHALQLIQHLRRTQRWIEQSQDSTPTHQIQDATVEMRGELCQTLHINNSIHKVHIQVSTTSPLDSREPTLIRTCIFRHTKDPFTLCIREFLSDSTVNNRSSWSVVIVYDRKDSSMLRSSIRADSLALLIHTVRIASVREQDCMVSLHE